MKGSTPTSAARPTSVGLQTSKAASAGPAAFDKESPQGAAHGQLFGH